MKLNHISTIVYYDGPLVYWASMEEKEYLVVAIDPPSYDKQYIALDVRQTNEMLDLREVMLSCTYWFYLDDTLEVTEIVRGRVPYRHLPDTGMKLKL